MFRGKLSSSALCPEDGSNILSRNMGNHRIKQQDITNLKTPVDIPVALRTSNVRTVISVNLHFVQFPKYGAHFPPGALLVIRWGRGTVVCMRDIFVSNEILAQDKIYILLGIWLR
jgi:hypothetical protein